MATIFTIDKRDLKKFQRMMKKMPIETRRATAGYLNSLAFETRKFDIENIDRAMVIRDRKFLSGSLIVKKTNAVPIDRQVAIAGSLMRPRFSGWKEQETGGKPKFRKGFSPAARKSNFKNKTIGKARLHPNAKFVRHTDFDIKNAKSDAQRIGVFLKLIKDRKNKSGLFKTTKSFIMPRYKGWSAGLYGYGSGRFQKFQDFDEMNKTPRQNRWRTASLNSLRAMDKTKIWAENFRRAIKRSKKA